MHRPDVLVLGGGGAQGEAWLRAQLAGLEAETGWDLSLWPRVSVPRMKLPDHVRADAASWRRELPRDPAPA